MGHDHSQMSAGMAQRGRLVATVCIGLSVVVVQIVGALWSGSLALLADTVHVFADVFGVIMTLVAITIAARPTKPRRTFGLYRLEIFVTVLNGVFLLGLSGFILYEGIRRWIEPEQVDAPVMLAAALYGLAANAVGVWLLRRGASKSLAVKGAYLEVLSDALGSVGVVIAAIVLWATGWDRVDSIVSIAIALFMIPRTLLLLRDALSVLMENAPSGLDLDEVRRHLLGVDGVSEVHDLHAWTITSGMASLSAHVIVEPDPYVDGQGEVILQRLQACVHDCFDIDHTTFQLESADHWRSESSVHP